MTAPKPRWACDTSVAIASLDPSHEAHAACRTVLEVAFGLGASGSTLRGEVLYQTVREATGAGGDAFLAETRIPRPSPANPGQNWEANDVETLWEFPMVGAPGQQRGRPWSSCWSQASCSSANWTVSAKVSPANMAFFAVPILGGWLSEKCCQAYPGLSGGSGFTSTMSWGPWRCVVVPWWG
jgi:hypothetical protein